MMSESNSRNSELSESYGDDESENGVTSSGSTDSSGDEDDNSQNQDTFELAKIANELLKLPRGLCENVIIFNEFFSLETWKLLSENFKTYLKEKHLPQFSTVSDDQAEKEKTVEMLFTNSLTRFGHTPLLELQRNLEEGNYRPDVLKLRRSISTSKKRERRFQNCENLSILAKQLFISRERLLSSSYKSSPDTIIKTNRSSRQSAIVQFGGNLSAVRARKRFCTEISHIAKSCGIQNLTDDENSDDLAMFEKDKQKENGGKSMIDDDINTTRINSTSAEKFIFGTQFKRKHDLSDEDAVRLQSESKQPKLNNKNFREYLLEHKRRKIIESSLPEFDTIDIRLRDVYTRAQVGGNFKRVFPSGKTPGRKPKSKVQPTTSLSNTSLDPTENKIDKNSVFEHANCETKLYAQDVCKTNPVDSEDIKTHPNENNLLIQNNNRINFTEKVFELSKTFDQNAMCEETIPAFIISNEIVLPKVRSDDHGTKAMTENALQLNTNKDENLEIDPTSADIMQANDVYLVNAADKSLIAPLTPIYNQSEKQNSYSTNSACNAEEERFERTSQVEKNTGPSMLGQKVISQLNVIPLSCPELIQETHACYFSLIRDFFCATPNHRMKFENLKEKVNVWLCNPITALNDWYSLAENWSALLTSAINFLAGDFADQPDEYVPYIEYKIQQNIYQWIGAGRDSDARLLELSKYWLSCRSKLNDKFNDQKLEPSLMTMRRRSTETVEDQASFERGISPPPQPRCPTTWTVTAATSEEVEEFQRQERERFDNPHRAYTYRMHGYESVVGPVKGIYSQILALTKARGHSMMIGDRPNFVTILTLVRDATARLPNGEGTRADISELLKCSQYINRDAAENVLQTIVSGALDRMHTEHDPCVRYDPKRKIWIYLHRNRSEEEFERMHQQYQGLGKHKKPTNRKTKSKTLMKEGGDIDFIGNSNCGMTVTAVAMPTLNSASSNVQSLPALVPANPIIVNTNSFSHSALKQSPLPNCPPVPPLKYNIQPSQQQKSLLKTTLIPHRPHSELSKPIESTFKQEFGNQLLSNPQNKLASSLTTAPMSTSLTNFTNKSLSFSLTSAQPGKVANIVSSSGSNTTPIIVATPTGLKTVHVSNATSVTPTNSSPSIQLMKNDVSRGLNAPTLSATVGGRKVALNKPIIINQITQQTQIKNKPPQTASKQMQKAQQQSFIIPVQVNNANSEHPIVIHDTRDTQHLANKQMQGIQNVFMENTNVGNTETQHGQQSPTTSSKNIIRLVPSMGSVGGKALITVPVSAAKQPIQIIGQRVVNNAVSMRPQLATKNSGGGISLISSGSASTVAPGAIVRMSSQAFSSLQQKQNQHLVVKPTQTIQQHRVVAGKAAINTSVSNSNKNVIVQQIPSSTISSSPRAPTTQTHNFNANTIKNSAPLTNISPQLSASKIQTINANNLSAQQQRILLQNLKQQSVHFKTVQILSSNATQQQQGTSTTRLSTGGPAMKLATTPIVKTSPQQNKTVSVVVSQPQNVACLLKTNSAISTQQQQLQRQNAKETFGNILPETSEAKTAINDSTGQIISLEGLFSKQGKTLRITNNSATKATTPQTGSIIQLSSGIGQQGDSTIASQYTVVAQPRNLITVGTQFHPKSSQANASPAVFTTPIAMSVATVKDAPKYITTSGKIVTSCAPHVQPMSKSILNPNIFGKTAVVSAAPTGVTSGAAGLRVIGTTSSGSFNIANIQGKQVILSSKPTISSISSTASQTQKIANPAIILGGSTTKLHGNTNIRLLNKSATLTPQANPQMQTVIMGNQILRVEQMPTAIKQQLQANRLTASSASTMPITAMVKTNARNVLKSSHEAILNQPTESMQKTLIFGSSGQMVRLQAPTPQESQQPIGSGVKNIVVANTQKGSAVKSSASRVVLAVQGGGQIFLSPNYQGNTVNLKSLQNVKVLSVPQAQSTSLQTEANLQQDKATKTSPQIFAQQSILRNTSGTKEES